MESKGGTSFLWGGGVGVGGGGVAGKKEAGGKRTQLNGGETRTDESGNGKFGAKRIKSPG